jgi:hypothetical protein
MRDRTTLRATRAWLRNDLERLELFSEAIYLYLQDECEDDTSEP